VAGIAPLVRPESPAMGGVIDHRQVLGLPLDGRDFYQLSLLLPGVAPAAEGSAGSVRGAFSIRREWSARGRPTTFCWTGSIMAIQAERRRRYPAGGRDSRVRSSGFHLRYKFRQKRGRTNQRSHTLRSNQLHGTAYEFFSNAALDGNNFFAPSDRPAPSYRRNQFGATLGGPLVKDRTFFFVDYQGTRTDAGQTLVANVPTLAERGGDFSQSGLVAADPASGQPFPATRFHSII